MKKEYQLIKVVTEDSLLLNGLYKSGSKNDTAYVLIHGFEEDFYSQDFYHTIVAALESKGSACILAQNRGTGLHTKFLTTTDKKQCIGSYYEKLSEAHFDISAFISYLFEEGYTKIGLIGHSLGTIKSVRYLFEGVYSDKINSLTLLSPFDKNAYMEQKMPGKLQSYVAKAQVMIDQGKGEEIVPLPEFEDYPMSYTNYVSWYTDDDFGNMFDFHKKDYDFPLLQKISVPVKVILGEKDDFVTYPKFGVGPESSLKTLKKYIPNCETALIKGCNHTFEGFEDALAEEVVK